MPTERKFITAAIDFGTTFSGYAYGFNTDLEKTPPNINVNKWHSIKNISSKAPTSVLFDDDGKFHSFGYHAEEKYAALCEDDEHKEWYFFRRFKMLLFGCEELSKETELREIGGKTMYAIDVFSAAIKFLAKHLMNAIHNRLSSISSESIQWVLTVPAIWNDASKMFMREAAIKAGIKDDQLTIALEPEAASVYCQTIPTEKHVDDNVTRLCISEVGSKFMVLDMGGGTVDITVHERQEEGTLKELVKANGGPWGGTYVDKYFAELLKRIFGGEETGTLILKTFMDRSMEDYVDFFMEFEVKKKEAGYDNSRRTTLKLPAILFEIIEEITGSESSELLSISKLPEGVTRTGDKLRVGDTVMSKMFEPAIREIVQHLKGLLSESLMDDVTTIIMVGGFSSSPLVQDAIKSNFPDRKVYIPAQPDLAVLMGAVLFGYKPEVIAFRVAKFTYGIQVALPFDESKHPYRLKKNVGGREFCSGLFSSAIHAGTKIKIGDETSLSVFKPVAANQTQMIVKLFAAPDGECPTYVSDDCCKLLGSIVIDSKDNKNGLDREFEVVARFGGTEIEFFAKERLTGRVHKTKCEFLG